MGGGRGLKGEAPAFYNRDRFLEYFQDNWHSKICKLAGKAHPNIYKAVELFKAEQTATKVSLTQLASRRNTIQEEKKVLKA